MNPARWMFEYHALQEKESMYFQSYFKIMKNLLVNVLGLNALRPQNPDGTIKDTADMTDDEKESFLPLIAWCGRPDMLKPVAEQLQLFNEEQIGMDGGKDYEALAKKIDDAGGDIEPLLSETYGIDLSKLPKTLVNPKLESMKQHLNIKNVNESQLDVEDSI